MAYEIERKFLVDTEKWQPTTFGTQLIQAYLGLDPLPVVRIRIKGEKAFLTIKGHSRAITRPEFEYEIPIADALEMIKLAISEPIAKTRYEVFHEGLKWEIDVFSGMNEGLVIAELELMSENQSFNMPEWVLEEVSGDARYYNSYLSVHPFQDWKNTMA